MTIRTTLLALAVLASSVLQAQNDAISTYFAKYVDNKDFTVVYISGKMFDLMESVIKNLDTQDMTAEQVQALTNVVQDMRSLRIITTDKNPQPLYAEAKRTLVGAKPYEVLMTVRDKDKTNVDFYVREQNGLVDELLLLVGEETGSFTVLSFEGRIDLNRVGELAKAFEDGDININSDSKKGQD